MKEYVNKTPADLSNLLAEKREALRHFRFGSAGGKAKNVKEGRNLRHEIARILTAMKIKVKSGKAQGESGKAPSSAKATEGKQGESAK